MSDNPTITYPFARIEKLIREDVRKTLGHQGQIEILLDYRRKTKEADAIIELIAPSPETTEKPSEIGLSSPGFLSDFEKHPEDAAPTFEDLPEHEQKEATEGEENTLQNIADEFDSNQESESEESEEAELDEPVKEETEEVELNEPVVEQEEEASLEEVEETELDNTDSLFGDD